MNSRWTHTQLPVFGTTLTAIDFAGERLLIGAQVAALLKRETFNMYRSMKIKRIEIRRANPAEVAYLVRAEAVRVGTHSVTLIPLDKGLYFIADATVRHQPCPNCECCAARELNPTAKATKSLLSLKPKIHRRKAMPWNVHRSLRLEDLARIHAEGLPFTAPVAATASAPASPSRAADSLPSPSPSPLRSTRSALTSSSSSVSSASSRPPSRPSSPSVGSLSDSSDRSVSASTSLFDALTTVANSSPAVDTLESAPPSVLAPPPLSPMSPCHSPSSDSSDSLPEMSPERHEPSSRKSTQLLPSFDRPLNCGFPVPSVSGSFLMFASY